MKSNNIVIPKGALIVESILEKLFQSVFPKKCSIKDILNGLIFPATNASIRGYKFNFDQNSSACGKSCFNNPSFTFFFFSEFFYGHNFEVAQSYVMG